MGQVPNILLRNERIRISFSELFSDPKNILKYKSYDILKLWHESFFFSAKNAERAKNPEQVAENMLSDT